MPLPTRVLLVDDSAPLRAAMRGLFRTDPSFDVVGEAADGATGVRLAAELAPDVVCMDVKMPGEIDGIEATRRVVAAGRAAGRVPVVIALSGSGEYTREMLDAGATTFVAKERAIELLGTIRAALAAAAR